jgi:hypothetical protein
MGEKTRAEAKDDRQNGLFLGILTIEKKHIIGELIEMYSY